LKGKKKRDQSIHSTPKPKIETMLYDFKRSSIFVCQMLPHDEACNDKPSHCLSQSMRRISMLKLLKEQGATSIRYCRGSGIDQPAVPKEARRADISRKLPSSIEGSKCISILETHANKSASRQREIGADFSIPTTLHRTLTIRPLALKQTCFGTLRKVTLLLSFTVPIVN
jgi:hypothetical protein